MPEVGGIECPGFDVEAFKAACRAPVYPGLINRWILVRTDADNASLVEVKDNAKAQLKHWFWPGDIGMRRVSTVQVTTCATRPAAPMRLWL